MKIMEVKIKTKTFTPIALLVVIAIVALLMGIRMPVLQGPDRAGEVVGIRAG